MPRRDQQEARTALRCLDLTALGAGVDRAAITSLCERAVTAHGPVAAVCLHGRWAELALDRLVGTPVRVASVANFPDGRSDIAAAVREVRVIEKAGAHEVDVVIPHRVVGTDTPLLRRFLTEVRAAAGPMTLKFILETGLLTEVSRIRNAAEEAVGAGADFIKTSTGMVPVNATPEAAAVMLDVIAAHDGRCGFKASGGIRRLEDAATYIALARARFGEGWVGPDRFRIGASGLRDALLAVLASPTAPGG
ncbi:MAG: deoxyribose-phosphate aldolase [Pseudomonadota bacterium]